MSESNKLVISTKPQSLVPRSAPAAGALMRPGPGQGQNSEPGAAFRRGWKEKVKRSQDQIAFAGLLLFSILLYIRPQDFYPVFGELQIVKLVGAFTLLAYLVGRLRRGAKLTIWTIEVKMVVLIYLLGWVMTPLAADPWRSISTLTDTFLKVALIFILMVNVLNTRRRLWVMINGIMLCGTVLATGAVKNFMEGKFEMEGIRIEGVVGGIFGNPNDLATALNLLIPLSIVLFLTRNGFWRLIALASAAMMSIGVLVTFSRAGFLGLLAAVGLMVWKLGSRNRLRVFTLSAVAAGVLIIAMPSSYSARLTTIVENDKDKTGSARERKEILNRAIWLAAKRPIIGVGMSNFPIYSVNERVAHNSFLEISAELGLVGLIAYLILIISPLKSCRRIERETKPDPNEAPRDARLDRDPVSRQRRELYCFSVGLQATLYAYLICSFFSSIEYLWYLYYPVAYIVSLRLIRAAEEARAMGLVDGEGRRVEIETRGGKLWGFNGARGEKRRSGVLWKTTPAQNLGRLQAR